MTLENPLNKSRSSSGGGSNPSSVPCNPGVPGTPAPATPCISSCSDCDSRMLRKFTASSPFDVAGTIYPRATRRGVGQKIVKKCSLPRQKVVMLLTGGVMFRSRPQFTLANHLCCFTWLAPLPLPSRRDSLLSSSLFMTSLPALPTNNKPLASHVSYQKHKVSENTHDVILGCSGKLTGSSSTFWNVLLRDDPLNGVVANCKSVRSQLS